jgi:hypothetical protein
VIRALTAALALASLPCCLSAEDPPPVDEYPGSPAAYASPPPGDYTTVQYVTLAASEPATIHYTVEGPDGTETGSGRNPAFWFRAGPGTTTFTFFAVDDAGNPGETATATYVVAP